MNIFFNCFKKSKDNVAIVNNERRMCKKCGAEMLKDELKYWCNESGYCNYEEIIIL